MNVLEVYKKIEEENIVVMPCRVDGIKGVSIQSGNNQGIFLNYDEIEDSDDEFCVAAHEYGHCVTGTLYTNDTSEITKRKCEYRADRQSVIEFLPINKFKEAIKNGCQTPYEFAEYLGLPEKFVIKAYEHYKVMGLL